MKIIIEGDPKEIAALELALKGGNKNIIFTQTINNEPSEKQASSSCQ